MKKSQKGFTLVELIVVIAIIGVLAAILVPSMMNYVKNSKLSTANSNAKAVYTAASNACATLETSGLPVTGTVDNTETADADVNNGAGYVASVVGSELGNGASTAVWSVKIAAGGPEVAAYAKTSGDEGAGYVGRFPTATTSVGEFTSVAAAAS